MTEFKQFKREYLRDLSIPRGSESAGLLYNLKNNGKILQITVRYYSPDYKAWDSNNDQFTDQYIGQDDCAIIRIEREFNLEFLFEDIGEKIEENADELADAIIYFKSGARGEIIINRNDNVYLEYIPKDSEEK